MIMDSRDPDMFSIKDDTILPQDPDITREWLVQFGEQCMWVRGWAIVSADNVVWRNELDCDGDDDTR